MTEIATKLWQFWSQFEYNGAAVPAYQSDFVPSDAQFPYIIFSPAKADALRTAPLTASVWTRKADGISALAQRTAIMDAVSKAIPVGGVMLPLSNGYLVLRRGSGDFLATMDDPDDSSVAGGRIGYEVTFCVL